MELKPLLKDMIDAKASDIFVVAGLPLSYEANGVIHNLNNDMLKPADTQEVVRSIYELANRDFDAMLANRNHDEDFSFAIGGLGRFRANVFRQRGSLSAVIRVIAFGLPDPKDYEIPEEVLNLARLQKGLVLVTGPAGSGKTTTLTCIIDRINHERAGHIITMEDPIEYVHRHGTCIVTQREIPTDVATFAEALRSALREAPDIILLGEMRERQIRIQLSLVLQAIVCQQLVPTVDGKQTPAFEIMHSNAAIRNLIREEKTYQIDSVIASHGAEGMRTMDQSLFALCKAGRISSDTALRFSVHEEALERRLQAEGLL